MKEHFPLKVELIVPRDMIEAISYLRSGQNPNDLSLFPFPGRGSRRVKRIEQDTLVNTLIKPFIGGFCHPFVV